LAHPILFQAISISPFGLPMPLPENHSFIFGMGLSARSWTSLFLNDMLEQFISISIATQIYVFILLQALKNPADSVAKSRLLFKLLHSNDVLSCSVNHIIILSSISLGAGF
jgi:hypothetical protein